MPSPGDNDDGNGVDPADDHSDPEPSGLDMQLHDWGSSESITGSGSPPPYIRRRHGRPR